MDLQAGRAGGSRRSGEAGKAILAVPLAMIALVTVVDVLAPSDVHLGPFLVAAPAITASFAGPWITAVIGAVAVLAQTAMVRGSVTDLNHTFQISALVLISVFVTVFAHLREVHEKEMIQLRSVAETAQQVVLRPLRERIGPLRIASMYLSAVAEAQIGGDLYAAARTAQGTRLIIGDVRGKGLEAVGEAALVLGAFRAAARHVGELPELVAYLEEAVASDLDDADIPAKEIGDQNERFVTAAVLDIPDHEPELHIISCGHPPPLLIRGHHVLPLEVELPAPPLGLAELLHPNVATETFAYAPGDTLLLYTDGVLEARDGSGAFYPLQERIATFPGAGPHDLLRHLHSDLLAHAAGGVLGDDAAMVAIQRVQ
ncbi:PP2C family protein-serine/threonine phosphatase [Streptomyces sp. NBC_01296]|nr:PP2C family protein-serine/threonine phosphatase [Streptomyces sp. NBC_01296]